MLCVFSAICLLKRIISAMNRGKLMCELVFKNSKNAEVAYFQPENYKTTNITPIQNSITGR